MELSKIHPGVLFENLVTDPKSNDDKEAIIDYFFENKNARDEDFHQWAESRGMDPKRAEEIVYELVHHFTLFYKGGKWNEKGRPDVDPNELKMGVEVEYEHTSCPIQAARIAKDHLVELPDYYTRLAKMEQQGKEELGISEQTLK